MAEARPEVPQRKAERNASTAFKSQPGILSGTRSAHETLRKVWLCCSLRLPCSDCDRRFSLTSAAQEPATGRKFAFLVGVEKYSHGKLHDLEFTENDVEDLADVLTAARVSRGACCSTTNWARQTGPPADAENVWQPLAATS